MLALTAEARKRQPKRAFMDSLPGAYQRNANLESLATRISSYQRGVVPGLLQIPEYAEAQMSVSDGVLWERSYRQRADRVAFRLERQRMLADKDLVFVFTDEALLPLVGGAAVMRRQIEHLLDVADRPNISLQVLSSTEPDNPCPGGGMVLLDFDDRTPQVGLLPVVWGPSVYLDDPDDTVPLPVLREAPRACLHHRRIEGASRSGSRKDLTLPDTGWFKSSYSGAGNDQCVEVRLVDGRAGVRDSKNVPGGALWVGPEAWAAFVSRVRGGSAG